MRRQSYRERKEVGLLVGKQSDFSSNLFFSCCANCENVKCVLAIWIHDTLCKKKKKQIYIHGEKKQSSLGCFPMAMLMFS
jgi:hypothetical protein